MQQFEKPRPDGDEELLENTKEIFESSKESYGSRRTSRALRALGYNVDRFKARSLMRKLGLRALPTRRFKVTINSRHNYPIAENLLARKF